MNKTRMLAVADALENRDEFPWVFDMPNLRHCIAGWTAVLFCTPNETLAEYALGLTAAEAHELFAMGECISWLSSFSREEAAQKIRFCVEIGRVPENLWKERGIKHLEHLREPVAA